MAEGVLLDTHALLWWQAASDKLSSRARQAIEGATAVVISPISCWEVAMLVGKGRVALDRAVTTWVRDLVAAPDGPITAELTPLIAAEAGSLDGFHGDPADRLIYATARQSHMPLITKDLHLTEFAAEHGIVRTIW